MSESEPPPVEGEVLRWCEEPVSGSGRYYWHILVNDGSHFVKWQSPTEPDGWEVAVHSRDEAILRLTSALADRDREVAALRGGQRREPASDEYVNSWDSSDPAEKWSDAHAYHAGFQAGFRTAEHYHGIADGPYMGPTPVGTPASTGAPTGPWLVVICREGITEATPFDDEADAVSFFERASWQWSDSYLCRATRWPRGAHGEAGAGAAHEEAGNG